MNEARRSSTRQLSRRAAFGVIGSAAAAVAAACGDSPTAPSSTSAGQTTPTSSNGACAVTPSETIGRIRLAQTCSAAMSARTGRERL